MSNIGFFIDDTRELEIPHQFQQVTSESDWIVFRHVRDMVRSEVFEDQPAQFVCFDYYLEHPFTGMDAMHEIVYHYEANGWSLPTASFHSSDPSMNLKMKEAWVEFGGPIIGEVPKSAVQSSPKPLSSVAKHFRRNKKK